MRRSSEIADLNVSVIRTVQDIADRGLRTGVFKRRADAIDVHMLISAFCFFRVSNRYTFGTIFQRDLSDPATYGRHKMMGVLVAKTEPRASLRKQFRPTSGSRSSFRNSHQTQ